MPRLMYHFVGCDASLKGISLQGFQAQLDFLLREYPREEIVLTFDHGTIDHIQTVAPELEKRGLHGMFFILTMIPAEQRVPSIDKQRQLEARFRTELARMLCAALKMAYAPETARGYLPEFRVYSPEERYLRYLRDRVIPSETYDGFVGQLFHEMFGGEKAFVSRAYLNWDHIRELDRRGHTIGSHSHYHVGDASDYARSLDALEAVLGKRARYVSYPNGVKRVADEELARLGIHMAYISTEKGAPPYRTGRTDCNQFDITIGSNG